MTVDLHQPHLMRELNTLGEEMVELPATRVKKDTIQTLVTPHDNAPEVEYGTEIESFVAVSFAINVV